MRIVCDNCGAKYQISDEKVRNKVFKIRCKRCAHVIVVRANEQAEQAAEAPAAQSAEAAPAPEAAAPSGAIWYVVINREQVGPLTPEQVLAHFERKDIDADTFTWAEGMTDWVRLATVPEFADQVAAAVHAEPAPAAQAPAAAADAGGGSLFDAGDDDDDDVIASSAQSESLFGDEKDGFDDGDAGPRVSSASQLRNQRNENSVLFSLDSLAAEAEPSRGVSNTGGTEGSGLIDISALGSGAPMGAVGGGAAMDDAFGGGADAGGFAPVSAAPAGPMPTYVTRPTSGGGGKTAMIVVLVLLVLGGGGAAAWYFLGKTPDPAKAPTSVASAPASAAPATVAIGAPKSDPPAPATTASAASVASAAPATAAPASAAPTSVAMAAPASKKKPTTARRRPKRPRAPVRTARKSPEDAPPPAAPRTQAAPRRAPARSKKNDEVDDLLGNLDGGGRKSRGRAPAPKPAAGGGGNPLLPEKLSKGQILQVVRKNAGKISGCKSQDPNASGTVKVTIVINGNGRVGSAKIPSGPFKGSPVGSCVEGKVRSFRFPQFSGDAMRINMPFRL